MASPALTEQEVNSQSQQGTTPQERAASNPILQAELEKFGLDPGPHGYGPNNEFLGKWEPEIASTLQQLVYSYRREGIVSRRHEIRRIRQARMFWQGLQYAYFSPQDMNWHQPFEMSPVDDNSQFEGQRYQFVTNYYQAFGLSFIALISQDVPSVVWFPHSAQSEEDIAYAKAATDITELIEDQNHVADLLTGLGYYLWTDGKIGAYVRFVSDADRFGETEYPDFDEEPEPTPVGSDIYTCPSCGNEQEISATPMCTKCGQPLTDEDYRAADAIPVPKQTGSIKVANGKELITIVGGLELNTPVWASEQHEFPYVQWETEPHKARLRAAYPHVRDKIQPFGSIDAEDIYSRVARLTVREALPTAYTGDALENLVTFMRSWIRPWAFEQVEKDEVRDRLKELFPEGCYVAFAGATYCESRSEKLDEHWTVTHAMPGDGQNRPGVGTSMVEIQTRYNVLSNIQAETYEYGIPPIYADPEVLDFDQLASQSVEPAAHYPAKAKQGQALANSFFQPAAAQVTKDFIEHQQDLVGPVAQMLTGLFPAVYGGSMDDIKTASAYSQARDQAMGRLGMVWRRLKSFYAATMENAVECFKKNRPDDVEIPVLGESGEFESKMIRKADLRGHIHAKPEASETFPRLHSQQKALLMQLMTSEDPLIAQVLAYPPNAEWLKNTIGLNEIELPGEDSRNKQLIEIEQLLAGLMVAIDPLFDDHAIELATCKEWANSEAGQKAKAENPQGFELVRQHAMAHQMALAAQAPPPMMPEETSGSPGNGASTGENVNA